MLKIYRKLCTQLGKQWRIRTECSEFTSNLHNVSTNFELRYLHCSDLHNSFFVLQIYLDIYDIVHKIATVCRFKYLRGRIHVLLLIFTQFAMSRYKYIIDLSKKNCIKHSQQRIIALLYVPEWIGAEKTTKKCFVVSRRYSGNCRKPTVGATWALRWAAALQSG